MPAILAVLGRMGLLDPRRGGLKDPARRDGCVALLFHFLRGVPPRTVLRISLDPSFKLHPHPVSSGGESVFELFVAEGGQLDFSGRPDNCPEALWAASTQASDGRPHASLADFVSEVFRKADGAVMLKQLLRGLGKALDGMLVADLYDHVNGDGRAPPRWHLEAFVAELLAHTQLGYGVGVSCDAACASMPPGMLRLAPALQLRKRLVQGGELWYHGVHRRAPRQQSLRNGTAGR